jgi:hypothetical protein
MGLSLHPHGLNQQQGRQRTCNVTLTCVRATVVVLEEQWVSHNLSLCICSLSYPAWNAHVPYCHLWPVRLYKIFPHLLINGTIFERKKIYWTQNVCFDFLYNFFWNISHYKKNWSRCCLIVHRSAVKYPSFLSDFNENWVFSTYFGKILICQISRQSIQWEPSCSMRTDGGTWRSWQSLFAISRTRLKISR